MRRSLSMPVAALSFIVCVAFTVVAGLLVLHGSDDQRNHVTLAGKRLDLTPSQQRGHEVFAQRCAICHTLAASHAVGMVGPNLDSIQPSKSLVTSIVTNGLTGPTGTMPSGLATGPDLTAVADYVSHVANRKLYKP